MRDHRAEEILQRLEKKKSLRSLWDSNWQDLKDLVRPNASDFTRKGSQGERKMDRIYDGTALKANEELSAGLSSRVSSSVSRWFAITHPDWRLLEDNDVLLWLEDVSDFTYFHYALPEVGAHLALHEIYSDLGCFGTGVLFQERDYMSQLPTLRACPLSSCWISENASGVIDSVDRMVLMSTRQAKQLFGEALPQKVLQEKDDEKQWTFIHSVFPRSERDINSPSSVNMPFASFWVCQEERCVVRESGYHENPYHVPRWTKIAGETYGRAPAMTCYPDILMVNAMSKTIIRSAQKQVDPPIIVDDDGVLLPLRTHPGGVILKTPGAEAPAPLITHGRVDIGLDMLEQRRDFIMRCFFVDYIRRQQKKERQSQLEIADDRNEMDQQMSAILGRLQAELHAPMLKRTFNMLLMSGKFPKPPKALLADGRKLQVSFISPAARAQSSSKIVALQQAFQDMAVLANIHPESMDVVNPDKAAQLVFTLRDVSRKIIRTPEEIAAIREQRSQAQMMAQGAEIGATAASGIKDLAMANASNAKANAQFGG